jgi:hypothetical protein
LPVARHRSAGLHAEQIHQKRLPRAGHVLNGYQVQ